MLHVSFLNKPQYNRYSHITRSIKEASAIQLLIMSHQDSSNLKNLLCPSRSGTFFAPFRSRSANPDGFDAKMKLWINAIEEWAVINKKLILSLEDIYQIFISDSGVRPDKECLRLVFSEMRRRSKLVPLSTLKTSNFWSLSKTSPILDNFIDPKGWLSWGVKKLVYNPATWAVSALTTNEDSAYSDLTDMSITDKMRFVSEKSLNDLSQNLLTELVRISKAEKQFCFEWQHLVELISPIMNTIIDATDGRELLELLDILIEYLAINKHVAIQTDDDSKLVKVANPEDSKEDDVMITKKDIAMARLLRAKELLTADADRYHLQAQRAKQDALVCYSKKELAKAKSLLRSHKRLTACADQKEGQLTNVEIMLDQLENTDSNMMILKVYKDGAEALRIANSQMDNNTSVLDEMFDVTLEARQLNDEMNQMLKDISCVSQGIHNTSNAELEAELHEYLAASERNTSRLNETTTDTKDLPLHQHTSEGCPVDDKFVDELEQRLNELVVCQHDPTPEETNRTSTPEPKTVMASSTAT